MIARCIVEIGTSSYYTALREGVAEPVLQEICRHIAADELRHYRLFYKNLDRCLARERLGRLARLRVAIGRVAEAAIRREKQIKEWKSDWKINLIERENPNWADLYPTISAP